MLDVDIRGRWGDFELDARFVAQSAGVTALFGRSGAGKTSVVEVLAGLRQARAGRVCLGEHVLFDSERRIFVPPERRRVGIVFQDGLLFPHLSVEQNLRYGERLTPAGERRIAFDPVVDLLGLRTLLGRKPRDLSGGEKQRVAIGRALLASPQLLLLDEPLASLDAPRRDEILRFIEALRDEFSLPVVYVGHDLEEVARLADDLVVLENGRVVASGAVADLLARPDLMPHLGGAEAGASVLARVTAHIEEDHLSELEFPGGLWRVPLLDLPVGATARLFVRARDVAVAVRPPDGLSVLNVFPGVVGEVRASHGAEVDLAIDVGVTLLARVTRRSWRVLDLHPGRPVYALVKAVAIRRG